MQGEGNGQTGGRRGLGVWNQRVCFIFELRVTWKRKKITFSVLHILMYFLVPVTEAVRASSSRCLPFRFRPWLALAPQRWLNTNSEHHLVIMTCAGLWERCIYTLNNMNLWAYQTGNTVSNNRFTHASIYSSIHSSTHQSINHTIRRSLDEINHHKSINILTNGLIDRSRNKEY